MTVSVSTKTLFGLVEYSSIKKMTNVTGGKKYRRRSASIGQLYHSVYLQIWILKMANALSGRKAVIKYVAGGQSHTTSLIAANS